MTHKFAKFLVLAVGALGLSALPALATQSCATDGLTVNSSLVCSLGGLTFTWEQVKFTPSTPPSTLELAAPFTGIYGTDYVLDFSFVNGPPPPVDILMTYEVSSTSANIVQVDSSFSSSDTLPPASIAETVCGVDPALHGGDCTDIIAQLDNSGGLHFSSTFGPLQNIWITKDIGTGGPVPISTFTDSVVATPEPSSIGLLLLAAFGIAATARKLRKA